MIASLVLPSGDRSVTQVIAKGQLTGNRNAAAEMWLAARGFDIRSAILALG
jgi:hypothetical protein